MFKFLSVLILSITALKVGAVQASPVSVLEEYDFNRTAAIVYVLEEERYLYEMTWESSAHAETLPSFVRLYRAVVKYRGQFKKSHLRAAAAGAPSLMFISPENTLAMHLSHGGLVAADAFAQMDAQDFNRLMLLLKTEENRKNITSDGSLKKIISAVQSSYLKGKKPLPFSEELQEKLESLNAGEGAEAEIIIEAETIVLTDALPEEESKTSSEGSTAEGLSHKSETSPKKTPSKTAQSKTSPAKKSAPQKVDSITVREQAPAQDAPTVHAKLAKGGSVVDKRVKQTDAKGGEVGEGGSGRLLQWVYSSFGVFIFIAFVVILNRYANPKK